MVPWITVVAMEMGKSWASSEIFRNKPNGTQGLTGYMGYTIGRNQVWLLSYRQQLGKGGTWDET